MVKPVIRRFEIWLVQLDPSKGSETRKTRPCVVISPDEMSSFQTAIVAPMTSKRFPFPTRISITFQRKRGLVMLDQMRAVDKTRLIQRLGSVSGNARQQISDCLQELFAL